MKKQVIFKVRPGQPDDGKIADIVDPCPAFSALEMQAWIDNGAEPASLATIPVKQADWLRECIAKAKARTHNSPINVLKFEGWDPTLGRKGTLKLGVVEMDLTEAEILTAMPLDADGARMKAKFQKVDYEALDGPDVTRIRDESLPMKRVRPTLAKTALKNAND